MSKVEMLNSGDIEGEIAFVTGQPRPEKKPEEAKPAADAKDEDAERAEDENGLTEEERKELTQKHQRAIGKKHRQMREAQEFGTQNYNQRVLAEQRAEKAERALEELKAKSAPPPEKPVEKPKRESFKSEDEYVDALVTFRLGEQRAKDEKAAADARTAEVTRVVGERVNKAAELVPDFREKVGTADARIPPAIAEYMQESELIAELAYHFTDHPEDLEQLSRMPTRTYADVQRLGIAIAKIESKLQPFAERAKPTTKEPTHGKPEEKPPEAKPSTTATAPSRPRDVPVITPLPSGSDSQVGSATHSTSEAISDFEKRNGVNLNRRRRN